MPSIKYYEKNAQKFFDDTSTIDLEDLYRPFLSRLTPGSTIVDAGCGVGRDALAFQQRGYAVIAFDACQELVAFARQHTGLDISCCRFDDFTLPETSVDGIWACASLLHVPYAQLPQTFTHFSRFLKPGGVLYCSFKYGQDESVRGLRRFTNMDEERLCAVVEGSGLRVAQYWHTEDRRTEYAGLYWVNGVLVKGA